MYVYIHALSVHSLDRYEIDENNDIFLEIKCGNIVCHSSTLLSNPSFSSPSEFLFPSNIEGLQVMFTLYNNEINLEHRLHQYTVTVNQPFIETYSSTHMTYTAGVVRLVTLDEDRRVSRDLEHFSQENSNLQARVEDLQQCSDDLREESNRRRQRLNESLNENRRLNDFVNSTRTDMQSTLSHDTSDTSDTSESSIRRRPPFPPPRVTMNPLFRHRRRRRRQPGTLTMLLGNATTTDPPPHPSPPPPPPPIIIPLCNHIPPPPLPESSFPPESSPPSLPSPLHNHSVHNHFVHEPSHLPFLLEEEDDNERMSMLDAWGDIP